jgi:tRNA threonylcarbamoyladenosine biosynthesis protein TsaE
LKSQTLFKQVASLSELNELANKVAQALPKNAILLLKGDLAAGKTTFVATLAKALGVKEAVSSPTFSLQQIYGDRLYHYDFYRIDFEEITELGLLEEFEKSGLHAIEWASDELQELLLEAGFELFELSINNLGDKREYTLKVLDA